jgi:hypothetical protein
MLQRPMLKKSHFDIVQHDFYLACSDISLGSDHLLEKASKDGGAM